MSARRLFWIALAVMLAGMALMFFWSAPRIDAGGLEPFDMRSGGYTFDQAIAFLTALPTDGYAAYLGPQRLADTLFPVGFLGVLALGTFLALLVWSRALAIIATIPALIYFIFDMLENAAVAGMLRAGAAGITAEQVARASGFTQWKMTFVNIALGLLVLALVLRAVAWIAGRR